MEMIIEITIVIAALIGCVALSVYYGNRVSGRSGSNIAEKHLKEQWGMDDKREYHD